MLGNNTININLIAKQVNTENNAWANESVISSSHKSFHRLVHWMSLDAAIN